MRPKLFRGQNAKVWCERLIERGWHPALAAELSAFLVGDLREPPKIHVRDDDASALEGGDSSEAARSR